MNTSITLNRMRFHAFHGVMEQERKVGNDFEVTLSVEYPFGKALESDNIADTLNYAAIYEVVAREMEQPSNLLEHVAGRIINAIRTGFPAVEGGEITVTKLTPPFKCQLQGVSINVRF